MHVCPKNGEKSNRDKRRRAREYWKLATWVEDPQYVARAQDMGDPLFYPRKFGSPRCTQTENKIFNGRDI